MILCHESTAPAERSTNRCPPSRGKPWFFEMAVLHRRVSNTRKRWHDRFCLLYETEKTQQRQATAELHGVFSSLRGSVAFSPLQQVRRAPVRDSEEVVDPFMQADN